MSEDPKQSDIEYNCNFTKLHGYKKHIVSNFLKDRHPYLEKPFNERYDPTEVFHAVFDRSIPKLVEILNYEDLPAENYREALMLLNEMASHQENKDIMISHNLVYLTLIYLKHQDKEVRRESQLLLGSLATIMRGRECLQDADLDSIPPSLLDERDVREVAGWMLCRQSSGRDGIDIIIKHDLVKYIIKAFIKYSEGFKIEESEFLIYQLECMMKLVQQDDGIENFLGTEIIARFNEILQAGVNEDIFGEYKIRIIYLCLMNIALISVNHDGKEESIANEIIKTCNMYLMDTNIEVVNYAVNSMMFASIHKEGKNQCIEPQDDQIVKRLIGLLNHDNLDIVTNVRQIQVNIADLPKGFNIIVKYLSHHIESLENIFGATSIIPLYNLLEGIDQTPFFTEENLDQFKIYGQTIAHFINSDKQVNEALQYSIEKTCRITNKLIPFQVCKDDVQFQSFIAKAIEKICTEDEVNKLAIRLFIQEKGDFVNEIFGTSVNTELDKYIKIMEAVNKTNEDEDEEGSKKSNH